MKIPFAAFLIALLSLPVWAAPGSDPYAKPAPEQVDSVFSFAPLLKNINIQVSGEILSGESIVPIGPVSLGGVGPRWLYEGNSSNGDYPTSASFRYKYSDDGKLILYCDLRAQCASENGSNTTVSFSGPVVFSENQPIQVTKRHGGSLTVRMSQQEVSLEEPYPTEGDLTAGKVLERLSNGEGVLLDHNVSLDLTGALSSTAGAPKQAVSVVFVGAGGQFPVTLYNDNLYGAVTLEGLQAGKYSVAYDLRLITVEADFSKTLLGFSGTVLCQPGVPVELFDSPLGSLTLTLDRVISVPDGD